MSQTINKICPICEWVTCECNNLSNCCQSAMIQDICSSCGEHCCSIAEAERLQEEKIRYDYEHDEGLL